VTIRDSQTSNAGEARTTGASWPRLHFCVAPDPARLSRARERIREYVTLPCNDQRTVDDIVLAVEEACANAICHSGSRDDVEITLAIAGYDLVATVKDGGGGFDPACFDSSVRPDPSRERGRGLYLISRLCDEVAFRRAGGFEVTMVKRAVAQACLPLHDLDPGVALEGQGTPGQRGRLRAMLEEIDEGSISPGDGRTRRKARPFGSDVLEAFMASP
jgi:anti-sigma regulatory factor (Ser/Thr protein kinase)